MDHSERNDMPDLNKSGRVRLMQQNRRLQAQIQKLDQVISTIIEKTVSTQFSFAEESQQLQLKYHRDQDRQSREILRLKKEIKRVKANLGDSNKIEEVKDEQNKITYLRMQYSKLYSEKQTLLKKKAEKQQALEFYKPLNSQTAATFDKYRKTKSQNAQLKRIINQKEKEVNKYHKIRQMAKHSVFKSVQNPNYEFLKIENEIQSMRKDMKRVQEKWKSKIDILDKEYFSFKTIFVDKEQQIQSLEKQTKNWDNKSAHFRDGNAIASDRLRVSSLVISPQKRKQMQDLLEEAKRSRKRSDPRPLQAKKKLKDKAKAPMAATTKSENQSKPSVALEEQELPKKKPEERQIEQTVVKEEVQKVQKQEELTKPNAVFESVGVGTSFYYAED